MRILLLFFLFTTALQAQLVGDTENGLASYYSREYDGAETAYGLTYDRNAMVAAHRTFPAGSTVAVKNLDNDKSVRVRIIDKGPFIRGRVIEVSERAADRLGLLGQMTVPVEVTLVALPSEEETPSTPTRPQAESALGSNNDPRPAPDAQGGVVQPTISPASTARPAPNPAPSRPDPAPAAAPTTPTPAPRATVRPAADVTSPTTTPTSSVTREPSLPDRRATEGTEQATEFAPGVYKVILAKKPSGNYAVQVGSYRDLESAMDKVAELQAKWFDDILVERVKVTDASLYKVLLGPFASMASAKRYAGDLKNRYRIDGFAVEFK